MTFQVPLGKNVAKTNASCMAVIEIILLGLCSLLPGIANAHILVYSRSTNKLLAEFNDMPAQFGPSLPLNGLKVFPIPAHPVNGCNKMVPPDDPVYPDNAKFVAIIERENCSFELKVRNAQNASFDAVVVYNNKGDDLETMSANNSKGIRIPSVFVGHSTGISLKLNTGDIVLIINDELPFNINTQLILPFSILIGLCFLTMVFYMIYKCIREERRLRRNRLPKSMLKKLPILKYSKNSNFAHETCVICIEDFVEGDKVRVLPCKHSYHSYCIDPWLTENRRVCPICKRIIFTKGEARNRNRQSSIDSVTDTDDDTTPLLQPTTNSNTPRSGGNNRRNSRRGGRNTTTSNQRRNAEALTATHHGTFRHGLSDGSATSGGTVDSPTSDDENVLLSQQSPLHSSHRVNPFDRTPNLPPQLAQQLNESSQRSVWSYPILRLFRRQHPISVAAPPYPNEVVTNNQQQSPSTVRIAAQPLFPNATLTPASATPLPPASNNILNPNLSGSFKDDDDIPHQSIYEPIATATPSVERNTVDVSDGDSIFIQTPVQGGIGVVALPNTAFTSNQNGADSSTGAIDPRFLV